MIKKMINVFCVFLITTGLVCASGSMGKRLPIDTKKSTLAWEASKLKGKHDGYVTISQGYLKMDGQEILGGAFEIDMKSLNNRDVEDKKWNTKLVTHLKSADFFDVEKFPSAKLKIKNSRLGKGGHYDIVADLTIKGITKPIMFKAFVKKQKTGMVVTAAIEINRLDFGMKYHSSNFFKNLGDKLIHNEVKFDVSLFVKN